MKPALLVFAAASLLRVCGRAPAPAGMEPGLAAAAPHLVPEHGGQIAVSGGLVAEVAPQADGRMIAYVRDPQGNPVQANQVRLALRRPTGDLVTVPVAYDPSVQGYVGRPAALPPGTYATEVEVESAPNAMPARIVTPPVTVAAAPAVPTAQHGGRVQVVGDAAVEVVPQPAGDVAMYWTDLRGAPIPPGQVRAPEVNVMLDGRPHVMPAVVDGDHLVVHVGQPLPPQVAVAVPVVEVRGVPYHHVVFPAVVVVDAPAVVVAPVVAPVVVAPRPVVIAPVVGWEVHGHGHGHGPGHGRGHGWGHGGWHVGFR